MNKTRIGGTSARQINLPFFPSRGSSSSSSQTPLSQGCRGSYLHLSRLQPSTFFSYVDVILPRCSSSPLPRAAARCPTRAHVRARYARVCPAEEAYPEGGYPGGGRARDRGHLPDLSGVDHAIISGITSGTFLKIFHCLVLFALPSPSLPSPPPLHSLSFSLRASTG